MIEKSASILVATLAYSDREGQLLQNDLNLIIRDPMRSSIMVMAHPTQNLTAKTMLRKSFGRESRREMLRSEWKLSAGSHALMIPKDSAPLGLCCNKLK